MTSVRFSSFVKLGINSLLTIGVVCVIVSQFESPRAINSQSTTIVERINVSSSGEEANAPSSISDINADGQFVVFASFASNLVDGDTNGMKDIFLRNRDADTTARISLTSGGAQVNGDSDVPVISADGRYVAFSSYASNLVAGDTNSKSDIFLHDTQTGVTTRISVATAGTQANDHSFSPSISSDGRYIAYESQATNLVASDTNAVRDIFVYDSVGATTTRVSLDDSAVEGDNESIHPAISRDGRFIAFSSIATNLVASDTNNVSDVFLHDNTQSTTIRVSEAAGGIEANGGSFYPTIDDDGSYIAYESLASNLITGDTNSQRDIFVYSRLTGETQRVSIATAGTQADNASGDGVDQRSVNISGNGQYITFKSRATNLVSGDINGLVDVFTNHQRESFITNRVSITNSGGEADGVSYYPVINEDGRYVSFYSYASNLVSDDTNGFGDIFVYDRDAVAALPTSTPSPTSTIAPTATPTPTGVQNPVIVGIPVSNTPQEIQFTTTAGEATVRCERVVNGGTLQVQVLTSPPGQLWGEMNILRTNFDISSSGLICNYITVCLPYTESEVTSALLTEQVLRLYHYQNMAWTDITSYTDTENNKICGRPIGFSPMVIGTATLPTIAPTSTPTPVQLPDTGSVIPTQVFSIVAIVVIGLGLLFLI